MPDDKVSSIKATPGAGASTLSQDYVEQYTYNGIGNIDAVTVKRDVHGPTPLQRTETYATTPWQAPPTPIVDKVKAIEYATTQGSPPARVGVRYGYDLANRLTSVTRTAGESETLAYGPTGELLYRQIGQRFVFYVGEYATVSAAGQAGCAGPACVPQPASVAVDAHVVYAGTRIASARTASQDGTVSGRTLFYYRTRLGSVIGTSERGSPAKGASYRYSPYGEVHAEGETEATRSELGYTNALKLTGSLWYLKNRVYDAGARVFIQSDWVDRLRYAYVTGDPVNLSDPTGLAAKEAPAEGGGGAATVRVVQDGMWGIVYEKQGDGSWEVKDVLMLNIPAQAEEFAKIGAGLQAEQKEGRSSLKDVFSKVKGWLGEKARAAGDATGRAFTNTVGNILPRGGNAANQERAAAYDANQERLADDVGQGTGEAAKALVEEAVDQAPWMVGGGILKIVQTGGRKLLPATIKALNKHLGRDVDKDSWRRAVEGLKRANHLPNDAHFRIGAGGEYVDESGNVIDHVTNYLP